MRNILHLLRQRTHFENRIKLSFTSTAGCIPEKQRSGQLENWKIGTPAPTKANLSAEAVV